MMLSDTGILEAIKNGRIIIAPFKQKHLGSCSVDFSLGGRFMRTQHKPLINPLDGPPDATWFNRDDYVDIAPRELIIASTIEKLTLSNHIAARLEGRSSLARLGLLVNCTADLFDPGWDGYPALELLNLGASIIRLTVGMLVCAFTFYTLSPGCEVPYGAKPTAKYLNQTSPIPPDLSKEKIAS